MRVATYNVHDCIGRDGRFDAGRIAALLVELDADLVALQEVTLDHAGGLIERFEAATGLQAVDGTLFERGVGRYGNVLLTGHKVIETRLHELPATGREPRGAIDATVDVGEGVLRVCATHLGLARHERRQQIERLSGVLSDGHRGALLLGDFNAWPGSKTLTPFADIGFERTAVRSFPTWPFPLFSLDRILARSPVGIARCWRHDSDTARIASDHFPVLAELRFAGWSRAG